MSSVAAGAARVRPPDEQVRQFSFVTQEAADLGELRAGAAEKHFQFRVTLVWVDAAGNRGDGKVSGSAQPDVELSSVTTGCSAQITVIEWIDQFRESRVWLTGWPVNHQFAAACQQIKFCPEVWVISQHTSAYQRAPLHSGREAFQGSQQSGPAPGYPRSVGLVNRNELC